MKKGPLGGPFLCQASSDVSSAGGGGGGGGAPTTPISTGGGAMPFVLGRGTAGAPMGPVVIRSGSGIAETGGAVKMGCTGAGREGLI
ncbi:hypothetical protein LGQ03_14245 [Loktanella sp. TSTF-M6]|uniref:Uncharacterized protein n=1 Tax=Loktanella gaetbuli TaxID=2881335 RepID=A0ABS8BXI2_9RHOB|nr:hypothetical protein [Loktanella gaetbuli]MCB5200405.1 hypothetical protein [Loktanella gaetbuli]